MTTASAPMNSRHQQAADEFSFWLLSGIGPVRLSPELAADWHYEGERAIFFGTEAQAENADNQPCALDTGQSAAAVAGLVEERRYYDVLMFRGWLVPERTAQEGQHGTLAESETNRAH